MKRLTTSDIVRGVIAELSEIATMDRSGYKGLSYHELCEVFFRLKQSGVKLWLDFDRVGGRFHSVGLSHIVDAMETTGAASYDIKGTYMTREQAEKCREGIRAMYGEEGLKKIKKMAESCFILS